MSNYLDMVEAANEVAGTLHGHRRTRSRRRDKEDEDKLKMRDPFLSDFYKIISSKAFRLLSHKTQVLTAPENPFIRTRRSHVDDVIAVTGVLCDMLGLNDSLGLAIAAGHDIGHLPFGHPGEEYCARRMGKEKGFCHEVLGVIVAQKIERRGQGLNLTYETLEGMLCHSGDRARPGMTQEAWVVRYADKIAYLFADFHDMEERMGYPIPPNLRALVNEFGSTHRERTTTAQCGLILESFEAGHVSFETSKWGKLFMELRSEMLKHYRRVTEQGLEEVIEPILVFLEGLEMGNPYLLFSLLTDQDVRRLASQKSRNFEHLKNTALGERLTYVSNLRGIDLCDPSLDW